jgi:hypothetical protein
VTDSSQLFIAGIAAGASILGTTVGATLQYFYSRSAEARRHERELRSAAYAEYLKSVGEMETASKIADLAQRAEIVGRAIAAKARVCVHGSAATVAALASFEGAAGPGLTPEKRVGLLEFIAAVRRDVGAHGKIGEAEINAIVFPSDTG